MVRDPRRHQRLELPPLPEAPEPLQYRSIFRRPPLPRSNEAHLDELERMKSLLLEAQKYRIEAFSTLNHSYPTPAPRLPDVPSEIAALASQADQPAPTAPWSAPVPPLSFKWHDYLMFWAIPGKRAAHEHRVVQEAATFRDAEAAFRSAAVAHRDDQAAVRQWRDRVADFEAARSQIQRRWEKAATEWDRARRGDLSQWQDMKAAYSSGTREGVKDYFFANLNAVPRPVWAVQKIAIEYECSPSPTLVIPRQGAVDLRARWSA